MIFSWWKTNKRDLPWRHSNDPYKILVSEVMLQQTQVARGLPKYLEFVYKFPTVQSLASASTGEILRVWKGMGYNRRALYLHKTAQKIITDYHGVFPEIEQQLITLPGLGKYTARAVMVFAYKKDIAMVDTNIRQIITHFFFKDVSQTEKMIQEVADQLVPKGKSWQWHQALMDYGALKLERNETKKGKKKHTPFKETNRYFRGRILDALRENSYQEELLIHFLIKMYGKNQAFYMNLLKKLASEDLIVYKNDIWGLPQ